MPEKILHIVGGLKAGGIESLLYNLFTNIDRDRFTFDFVKKIDEAGEFERPIREIGGHIFKCPKYNGFNYFSCKKWWSNFFDKHPDYKIIHVHDISSSFVYLSEAKKRNIKIVAHSHNVGNTGIKGIVKNFTKKPIRKYADQFVACSKEAGEYLFGEEIVNTDNYNTIPNGIETSKFLYDKKAREDIRNYLGISEKDLVIGHIGRFTKVKNHAFLLKVFAETHSFRESTKLLLIGDGPLFSDMKKLAEKLGIQDSVIFTGAKIDSEKYYSVMDVFVFPSYKEGLGIAAIEAQASGLNVIKSAGVPDSVDVTGNVRTLGLHDPIINWAREILQCPQIGREDIASKVYDAGYDIMTSVGKLEKIYTHEYEETIKENV